MVEKGFPRRGTYHVLPAAGFECLPPATVVTPVNRLTLIGDEMLLLLKAFLTIRSDVGSLARC